MYRDKLVVQGVDPATGRTRWSRPTARGDGPRQEHHDPVLTNYKSKPITRSTGVSTFLNRKWTDSADTGVPLANRSPGRAPDDHAGEASRCTRWRSRC